MAPPFSQLSAQHQSSSPPPIYLQHATHGDVDGVEDGAVERNKAALEREAAVEATRAALGEQRACLGEHQTCTIQFASLGLRLGLGSARTVVWLGGV